MSTASDQHFDLIIIGTGSGNSIIGPDFDSWRIAVIEEGVFGGTCLNRGCIPTKMFVYAADVAESIRHASRFGVDAQINRVRWRDIRDRVFNRIDPIAAGGEEYRTHRCANVTVFKGRGRFTGDRTVEVALPNGASTTVTADRVVVSVGARPADPGIEGLDRVGFHTSDTIMRVDELPEHLVVVGGGFIANELAHVFGSLGSRVTLVHRGDRLLREQDDEISRAFTDLVSRRERFDVRLNTTVTRAIRIGDSTRLELSDGTSVEAGAVLVATGRVPNADLVDARAGGLDVDAKGRVIVDDTQATSAPGVWALGDVSSPHMLKHVANHEMRVVRENLLADRAGSVERRRTDHRFVPSAVFTDPQLATVGLTERAARAGGHDVVVKTQRYGDTAYGWAMEDSTSVCKLVADRSTRTLLGAHLMGPYSSMLIQQLIQGMSLGQTVDEMAKAQYYIHPALPEVTENALLGLLEAF